MKIGDTVKFLAAFEDLTITPAKGTVADIREGVAYAFVLGFRWPFAISLSDPNSVGHYPRTEPTYIP